MQYQRALPLLKPPSAKLRPLGELFLTHQQWHARQTVCAIARLARQGMSDAELVKALLPT